jgi:NitT/TauT family transport system ATP-binding protein
MDDMSADPLLSLDGVCQTFDGVTSIIDGLNMYVEDGEFVAVVGPTGCGKSTLLRLVAGLDHPTAGIIERRCHSLQMLFQEPALLPWRTLRENVALVGELQGHALSTEEVDAVLSSVDLSDHSDKFPHQLSGGMKMRTSLARSLAAKGDLYLFDEPFSAVDEITREKLNRLLHELSVSRKLTCVFVTHNISEAVYLSHRVLVMSHNSGAGSRITHDIPIVLPMLRNNEIRFTSQFQDLCKAVHTAMSIGGTP